MRIGFVGGGKMAEAIVSAVIDAEVAAPHEILVSDAKAERRDLMKQTYGINAYARNDAVISGADVVFLAVKPQDMESVLAEIRSAVTAKQLFVSIAAGKTLDFLQSRLPGAKVVRVMPNMAAQVGDGMSVFCAGAGVGATERAKVAKLLECFGRALELPEEQMDAVTALSGSGPAFFAWIVDALAAAAAEEGVDRKHALLLAEQTMKGTARMLMERNMDPAELVKAVASPKGTTAEGLKVLDASDVRAVLRETLAAAARRSRELSRG